MPPQLGAAKMRLRGRPVVSDVRRRSLTCRCVHAPLGRKRAQPRALFMRPSGQAARRSRTDRSIRTPRRISAAMPSIWPTGGWVCVKRRPAEQCQVLISSAARPPGRPRRFPDQSALRRRPARPAGTVLRRALAWTHNDSGVPPPRTVFRRHLRRDRQPTCAPGRTSVVRVSSLSSTWRRWRWRRGSSPLQPADARRRKPGVLTVRAFVARRVGRTGPKAPRRRPRFTHCRCTVVKTADSGLRTRLHATAGSVRRLYGTDG